MPSIGTTTRASIARPSSRDSRWTTWKPAGASIGSLTSPTASFDAASTTAGSSPALRCERNPPNAFARGGHRRRR